MTSKRCSRCKRDRGISFFSYDRTRNDGRSHRCEDCQSQLSSLHYRANKAAYARRCAAKKERNYHLIRALKARPCTDCEIEYAPWVMQFDHTGNDKLCKISSMRGYSEASIRAEAEKCDVVCANCHAHRTYLRQGKPANPKQQKRVQVRELTLFDQSERLCRKQDLTPEW